MSSAAALLLALALARGAGAAGGESDLLWQLPAGEACRLRLVNDAGAVEVLTGGTAARLLGVAGRTRAEATATEDAILLTVSAPPDAAPGESRVILEAPGACELFLRAGQGEIEVHGPRLGRLAAETTTGDITLWVGPSGGVAAELATSGEITVDFSVTIDYFPHQEPAKHGKITTGVGASSARLTSLQGAIRVLRLRPGQFENRSLETGVGP